MIACGLVGCTCEGLSNGFICVSNIGTLYKLASPAVIVIMIKIDFKQYIRDRMWCGWYWAKNGGYNPLHTGDGPEIPGWARARTPVAWVQKIR